MLKNATSVVDDRGYNQGFKETPALKKRMEKRAEWMISEMNVHPDTKVMEIGCGTGYISYYIALKTNMQVIGSDLCVPFIKSAREKYQLPNLSYVTLDFNKATEMITDKFDYIIGNGILHHLYYTLDNVLLTFGKILNTGGKIIFIEPNIYNPYVAAIFKNKKLRKWARLEHGEMAFSGPFIRQKLAISSYGNIKIKYIDFLLPGIPQWLINPSIVIGNLLEKTPLKLVSQSILISAVKQ
jgi:2-polyprenyl-3-methyl-5-hydroxy-6-metoxy-1,4-benzoquinol methylase